ncbi:hypothetical protein D3C75_1274420 [compost metagenome]
MFFGQRLQRHRRGVRHLNGAEVLLILKTPNPQNIARFEMRFTLVADGDGFTPGQNVILKTLKKSNVVWLHVIIP